MNSHPSRGQLDLRAALEVVGKWATEIERQPGGWARLKSLLFVIGHEDWNAAVQVADAMGVHADDMELLYHQLAREKAAADV